MRSGQARGGKAMIATLRRVLITVPARLVRHGGQLIMPAGARRGPAAPLSWPRSAPCQLATSTPQASAAPAPRSRHRHTVPRPPATRRPHAAASPQNPRARRATRAIITPACRSLAIPRSSTRLRINCSALLVDSGQKSACQVSLSVLTKLRSASSEIQISQRIPAARLPLAPGPTVTERCARKDTPQRRGNLQVRLIHVGAAGFEPAPLACKQSVLKRCADLGQPGITPSETSSVERSLTHPL